MIEFRKLQFFQSPTLTFRAFHGPFFILTRYYSFYGWKNRFTVVQRKFKMFKCFIALCTSKKSRKSSSSGGESLFLKGKKRARKSCAFCGKQHMNALSTFFSILISRQAQSCLNTVNKFNFVEKNVLLKIRTIHSRVEYRPFLGLRERPLNDVQF